MHEAEAGTAITSDPDRIASIGVADAAGSASTTEPAPAPTDDAPATSPGPVPSARGLRWATLAVFATALIALVPTIADLGLTWDEPAYRYSQVKSAQWWEQWGRVRSRADAGALLEPSTLLYYWPYGRFGINFHPPLAGQLNLAAHAVFGHWMKDIPSRRMATMIEFALTIAIGFHFLARRYGTWVGVVMAGSLLLMPRLYGQAHLIDTDTPGLLLWGATALAFWKGLYEPGARRWRVLVGILLGLAFVEKMGAVMVLLPILFWLAANRLAGAVATMRDVIRALRSSGPSPVPAGRLIVDNLKRWLAGATDGLLTTGAMLVPLGMAFQQIQLLQRQLPRPDKVNELTHWPASDWPGAILAIPMAVWLLRRLLGRLFPRGKLWGVERPALETFTAILALAPLVGWLGNPAWWRETLPRLSHYYMLTMGRDAVLPPIQILYFGQVYVFSLPWHNAFVLMTITVPVAILASAAVGVLWGPLRVRRDRLPLYFLVHFLTLPVIRMFPTPAHDGVRLFLPTFFFLSAFAGWGTVWLADALARLIRSPRSASWMRLALAGSVLGSSAVALVRIHPYELSYYNELIGGPRGAWERGFELTYWYDAFTPRVIDDLNRRLPPHAEVDFLNKNTETSGPVFQEQQSLGILRGDIGLARTKVFPYVWLLAQDSKATALTRLLFGMRPWYANEPPQLDGARVVTVADPIAVSRAWGLWVLLEAPDLSQPDPPASPAWVRKHAAWLGRLWGDGLLAEFEPDGRLRRVKVNRLAVNQAVLDWSRDDPEGLLTAASRLAEKGPLAEDEGARRLYTLMTNDRTPFGRESRKEWARQLFAGRPEALVEAVKILNAHRDEVVQIITRYAYTDPSRVGGYLDRDLR